MAFLERLWTLPPLRAFSWCLFLSLVLGPSFLNLVVGELDVIDMDDYLDNPESDRLQEAQARVRQQWGLTDTVATEGKLFRYHIPSDSFAGDIQDYEVREAAGNSLPKWLYFNKGAATLEGLPTIQDVGQFDIVVTAFGTSMPSDQPNLAEDEFSIRVSPQNGASSSDNLHCDRAEEMTTATIVLDGNLYDMDAVSRIRLVNRTLGHFRISEEELLVVPMERDEEAFSGKIFLARPIKTIRIRNTAGLHLRWQVSCGYWSVVDSLVNSLEKSASDGTLSDALGLPVIRWHLAIIGPASLRQKRQQPSSENQTATSSMLMPDPLPQEILVLANGKTEDQLEVEGMSVSSGHVLPKLDSSTFGPSMTASFRPEKPLMTALPINQNFEETPALGTPMPTLVLPVIEPTRFQLEPSTKLPLQSSLLPSREPRIETAPLPEVVPHQATGTVTTVVDTSIIKTIATTQLPQSVYPSTPTPDYKLDFVAGRISRFVLPQDGFAVLEDGGILAVSRVLAKLDGVALPDTAWIRFDRNRQEVYALPLANDVGKHYFVLWVNDSSLQDTDSHHVLEVNVLEDPRWLAVNHEFAMLLNYDVHRFRFAIDWQVRLLKKLAAFFGVPDDGDISVRSVTADPVVFAWTNVSLPNDACPREALDRLLHLMSYKGEGISTLPLRKVMSPEFRVSKVTLKLFGECKPELVSPSNVTVSEIGKPQVRNHIDRIRATVGRMLRLVVPADTFFDAEDGGTRNLTLRFLTIGGVDVAEASWIQFLDRSQELRGLPMADDVGSTLYQLVAVNARNASVSDALLVTVVAPPDTKPPSVEFSLRLAADLHVFDKYAVLYRLARLFRDPDPRHITVRGVTAGSVIFLWTNHTLPSAPCPTTRIGNLVRVMFDPDGSISDELRRAIESVYPIMEAEVIPGGVCLADVTPTKVRVAPSSTAQTDHAYADDDVYVTTIVPAVVIAAMLVVAAGVACALYRNKRKGKVTADEDSPFITKGIPIVFAEELVERPATARSSRQEKSRMPPPEYSQSSSGTSSPPEQPEQDQESSVDGGAGPDEEAENSPRYQPPPPFVSSVDTSVSRPKHTPDYRLPPPYVPP